MTSYPTPAFRRIALAPAILAALVALAGVALVGGDAFTIIRFALAILSLIIAWFAYQAQQWWWIVPLLAIAIVWNPVLPVTLDTSAWLTAHYLAAAVFIACGILIKVRNPEDRNAARR